MQELNQQEIEKGEQQWGGGWGNQEINLYLEFPIV